MTCPMLNSVYIGQLFAQCWQLSTLGRSFCPLSTWGKQVAHCQLGATVNIVCNIYIYIYIQKSKCIQDIVHFLQGQGHLYHYIVLYICNKYEVCKTKSIQGIAHFSFFETFDLDLWPWPSFKVKVIYIITSPLWCCTSVPNMKSVRQKAYKI